MNYKYNFKNALTYFLQDEKLAKKFGLGYLIIVLSMAMAPEKYRSFSDLVVYCIGMILILIFHGYTVNNSHIRIFKPENILPEWRELPQLFKKGLCSTFGPTIFSIALGIPLFLMLMGVIYLTITLKIAPTPAFVTICTTTVLLIAILIVGACVSYISYIANLKFKSCFSLKSMYQIIFKNFSSFIGYLSVIFVITLIFFLVVIILITVPCFLIAAVVAFSKIAVIDEVTTQYIVLPVAILLPPLATMYFSYIYSDINAQFIRQISNSETSEED